MRRIVGGGDVLSYSLALLIGVQNIFSSRLLGRLFLRQTLFAKSLSEVLVLHACVGIGEPYIASRLESLRERCTKRFSVISMPGFFPILCFFRDKIFDCMINRFHEYSSPRIAKIAFAKPPRQYTFVYIIYICNVEKYGKFSLHLFR